MKRFFVKDKQFYYAVLAIALPVAMQQVINLGVNLADQVMLGQFGETQISACSLANQFYFIFNIICFGISGGACVLTAQYWGAKKPLLVKKITTLSFRIVIGISILFALLSLLWPSAIMELYTSDVAIIEAGDQYLRIMGFVYLIHGTAIVAVSVLRTVGVIKLGLYISIISFFVNLFFNYVFIFGEFGFPRMEIAGAAVGTLIARTVEFVITFGYMFWMEKGLSYRLADLRLKVEKELIQEFIRIGSPVILSDTLLTFGNNALAMIMGRMGSGMVSAYSITNVVVHISTVFINGLSSASSVVTGNTIGKGEKDKALAQGYTFFALSILIGILGAFIIKWISPLVISFYQITPETVVLCNRLTDAIVIVVVFQCVQGVMTKGVLRGGGDTKFLLLADVFFLWAASIPLGYLCGLVWKLDAFYVYIALRIDFIIKAFWCYWRLDSGKWIKETDAARAQRLKTGFDEPDAMQNE